MKKIFFAVFAVLFFLTSADVRAEPKDGKKLNWKNLKAALLVIPPAYFAQVAIHEGSHAIAAKSFGAEITEFNIFPAWRDGRVYFGHVGAHFPGPPTNRQTALFAISPKITDIGLFTMTEIIFRAGSAKSDLWPAAVLFVFGELMPWIDFTVGIISPIDMGHFESATGLRPSFTRTIGAAVSVAGFYFLFERAKRVFWRPCKGRPAQDNLSFAVGANPAGIIAGGRF